MKTEKDEKGILYQNSSLQNVVQDDVCQSFISITVEVLKNNGKKNGEKWGIVGDFV